MKFLVEKVEVLYTTVLVEVPDAFEGDLELEAKWCARRGLGQVVGTPQKCTADVFPWQDWNCEKATEESSL